MITTLSLGKLAPGTRVVVLSDLHLGDPHLKSSTVRALCAHLEIEDYDLVVLAGDIWELWQYPDRADAILQDDNCKLFMRCLHGLRGKVLFVVGNHDWDLSLRRLRGGDKLQEAVKLVCSGMMRTLEFRLYGKRFRIQHGDAYDPANAKGGRWWARLLSSANKVLGNAGIYYGTWRDRFSFARDASERMRVEQRDRVIAKNWDVDWFILGHTHRPEIHATRGRTVVVNAGSVMSGETFVRITDGVPEIFRLS